MPPDLPSGASLQRWPYQKNILILLTQKVDQYTFSAYRPNFFWGGGVGVVVEEIIKFWRNLEICGRIHIL